jgi:glycosyltransferase involved in cell wall biosynthesis
MCDAFAGRGCDVTLRAERGNAGDLATHYGLRHGFHVCFESSRSHKAWLFSRRVSALGGASAGTLYFGRRMLSLSKLARWGYATGLELHHPPRTERQLAALTSFVQSPGFRGLVVISKQLRDEILRLVPSLAVERVLVAHDGVRSDRIVAPRRHDRSIGRAVYCGSLHPGKGMETLLPSARLVPEVTFDVIGGEPEQIERLRVDAPLNVRFLGHMAHDECQRRLLDYDLALAPYGSLVRGAKTPERESLASWMSPLKLFEYMGAGLPIVTSDLPVLRELLHDGQTALMPPPDDPEAFGAAVSRLARDADLRARLADAAQARLRNHTWENRASSILAFLAPAR